MKVLPILSALFLLTVTLSSTTASFSPSLDQFDHVGGAEILIHAPNRHNYSDVEARYISNKLCKETVVVNDPRYLNSLAVSYGQFVDHEIVRTDQTNVTWPMPVPCGDYVFDPEHTCTKTLPFNRTGRTPRNSVTPFVDGSAIYGLDLDRLAAMRVDDPYSGMMRLTEGNQMLPQNHGGYDVASTPHKLKTDMFLAGDVRATEQPGLTVWHTFWIRSHNEVVPRAYALGLKGYAAFEYARRINVALEQKVTFEEYVPALIGKKHWKCELPKYAPSERVARGTQIRNVFAVALYRLHSMVPADILVALGKEYEHYKLRDIYFAPEHLRSASSLEPFMRAFSNIPARKADLLIITALRDLLFRENGTRGHDLAATNIQRGRDTGVPPYNDVREFYGFSRRTYFSEVTSDYKLAALLDEVYPGGPDECDTWVCGFAEDTISGGSFGELVTESIREQFCMLRNNDPNYYPWSPYLTDEMRTYVEEEGTMHKLQCKLVGGTFCARATEGDGGPWMVPHEHKDLPTSGVVVIIVTSIFVLLCTLLVYFCTSL